MEKTELLATRERALSGIVNRSQGKTIILKLIDEIERLSKLIDKKDSKKDKTKVVK